MSQLFLQYSPVFVKNDLLKSLSTKIKVLKLLARKEKVNKEGVIKTLERLLTSKAISKSLLDYIGMTAAEYKKFNPKAEMFQQEESAEATETCPVMTSRVKPLEDVPIKPKREGKLKSSSQTCHAHNDMLSPYSNLIPSRSKDQSKSPRRQEPPEKEDLTRYLNAKGEIQYAELLTDEIALVDQSLLKACKKHGQLGGMPLPASQPKLRKMTFLICRHNSVIVNPGWRNFVGSKCGRF